MTAAHGHGDVHESIAVISRELEAKPDQPRLLLERASLYSTYDHWTEALADLDRMQALEPGNDLPLALRAGIYRRSGRPAEARVLQEALLKKHPQHLQVRFDYSQTLADLKDTPGALRELDTLIGQAEHPPPDAVALRLKLAEAADPAAALTWLDEFLAKHPLPVFQEEALRLELKLGRPAAAVQRMDAMIAKAPRPEFLLLRKAEVLSATGDRPGAATAVSAARAAIARLPAHVRSSKACLDLETKAAALLPASP